MDFNYREAMDSLFGQFGHTIGPYTSIYIQLADDTD